MKRTIAAATLVIVFATVLVLGIVPGKNAHAYAGPNIVARAHAGQDEPCSNASLSGSFGFTATGTVLAVGPVAQVGRQTFDGEGNTAGTGTISANGNIFRGTFTGTYTVNPDCTGSLTFEESVLGVVHADVVIVDDGREFRAIQTDPGVVLTVVEKKQFPNE